MNKDIRNYNDKEQYHGHQQWHSYYNKLIYRGNKKNDESIGYVEWHWIKETIYYIK